MHMTGRGYLLAVLAATVAVAGCATASAQEAGGGQPPSSTGTSSTASPGAAGEGTPATSSPANGPVASGTSPLGRRPVGLDCTAAELRVTVGPGYGGDDTASGHAELALWFTNLGSRVCFMQGYPGVEVSGPDGALNAQRAIPGNTGQSPSLVTVPPGGTASALLGWAFFPQDGSGTVTTSDCPGYHATRLLVTAPDQTTSTVLAAPAAETPVCWEFAVEPVVLGATGWS